MSDNDNNPLPNKPMAVEDVRAYLQALYGVPVVLREEGATNVKCVYCGHVHEHPVGAGFYIAGCDDEARFSGVGIVVGDRYFATNYGYKIIEYKEVDGVNTINVPMTW
jgi:hypothetical protein